MTATASGGLPGLGAGEGNLGNLFGAGTDLVFGMLAEEWGLIIAVLAVLCIITLTIFAFRSIAAGRSTYYSIAACSTSTLFVFQTMLNVLGSVDILPLTGVTFPFLSSGGTSMIASWGLLAFLKAADTRQNASFAIRLDRKSEFKDHLADGDFLDPEDIFSAVDGMEGNSALSISEQMDNDPEFQKYWEEKQRLAQAQPRNTRPAAKYQTQVPRGKKGKKDAEAQSAPAPQPKKQKQQKQKPAQPKQQPQPSAPQQPREERQARPEPAPKRKASAKPRPRPVSYKNVDDDAFFRSLDEKGGRTADGPTIHMYDDAEGDQPVTLEDLFGGDNK